MPSPRVVGPGAGGGVLFRVAAGPRLGVGHLVRAARLAALTGASSSLSLRGRLDGRRVPLDPGWRLMPSGAPEPTLARLRPALLVVDDPVEGTAGPWLRAARRLGCPTVGMLDFGLGARGADVVIDGSLPRPVRTLPPARTLRGPRYAVVDPALTRWRLRATARETHGSCRVLVALGGGRRTSYACRIARAVRRVFPEAQVTVAGGFAGAASPRTENGIHWLAPQPSLLPWLARSTVVVVAGGITLYEACALGVPTVALPVVWAQRRPVSAFAWRGAVLTPRGVTGPQPAPVRVAEGVAALLARPRQARAMAMRAGALVDGQGPRRVAHVLRQLAAGIPPAQVVAAALKGVGDTL